METFTTTNKTFSGNPTFQAPGMPYGADGRRRSVESITLHNTSKEKLFVGFAAGDHEGTLLAPGATMPITPQTQSLWIRSGSGKEVTGTFDVVLAPIPGFANTYPNGEMPGAAAPATAQKPSRKGQPADEADIVMPAAVRSADARAKRRATKKTASKTVASPVAKKTARATSPKAARPVAKKTARKSTSRSR